MKKTTMQLRAAAVLTVTILTASAVALAAPPADDDWMAAVEGGWAGQAGTTPMGPMPFVMLFDAQEDGSLHSRTALNQETYIELRFWKDDAGRWMLTESAGLEGEGEQSYDLVPVASNSDARRWEVASRPDFMTIDVAVVDETMQLDVEIHGRPHAAFTMERLDDARLPELRASLAEQASKTAEENSIHDVVNGRPPAPAADPIEEARKHANAHPESAEASLELARKLSAAIQSDPTAGPRYAFELLQTLERTKQLDPSLVETYHYLVGYYLNAPAIAGGSIQKAEETAKEVAKYDSAASEALLGQVEGRRAGSQQAGGH